MIITFNHFWGPLCRWTIEPFGFVSGAAGFVFLSGIMAGMVYGKYADDLPYLKRKTQSRAWLVYKFHVGCLAIVYLIAHFSETHVTAWWRFIPNFIQNETVTIILSLFLLEQPAYMDLLPLYCILFFLTPYILKLYQQGKAVPVLFSSLILWLVGQFVQQEMSQFLLDMVAPELNLHVGFFDPLAWQLLYVVGSWLGYSVTYERRKVFSSNRWVNCSIIIFATLFMIARWYVMEFHGSTFEFKQWLEAATGKPDLKWLRILNFALLAYCFGLLIRRFPNILNIRWLTFLGQHSLQVFSFHIILLFMIHPYRWELYRLFSTVDGNTVVQIFAVASLIIPAWLHKRYQLIKA